MKQFGIYIAILLIATACANQGDLAQYDDDGIYATTNTQKSGSANADEAYYFVDEAEGSSGAQREYYGSDKSVDQGLASNDDYVPEAKSLPSESGRAYSNQRYNQPTTYSAYSSSVPITMRLGYSSFHNPAFYGGGISVNMMYGYGYNGWGYYDYLGMGYYDPWDPFCRWNRWNRWNSWYSWSMWSPYGPYGMGFGSGYAMGFYSGYFHGVNSYNYNNTFWSGETAMNNTYTGPRSGFTGGSFNGGNSNGFQPRSEQSERPSSVLDGRNPARDGVREESRERFPNQSRTPDRTDLPNQSRTPDQTRIPDQSRSPRPDETRGDDRRPMNPNATRTPTPDRGDQNRPRIRWNNGSRTPDMNRGGSSRPNSGYTPPSNNRNPGNYSPPSRTPSRSPSRSGSFSSPSPSTPKSSGGGSRSGGNSKRGGFR